MELIRGRFRRAHELASARLVSFNFYYGKAAFLTAHYDRYVFTSASYCRSLFRVSRLFFKVQELIEGRVLYQFGAPSASSSEMQDVLDLLIREIDCLAREFKLFLTAHKTYPAELPEIGGASQVERISEISLLACELKMEILSIWDEDEFQEAIWARPRVSSLCQNLLKVVSDLNAWQLRLVQKLDKATTGL